MFDWVHDRHVEKGLWYGIIFAAGFVLGFFTQLLLTNPLNIMLIYGLTGGAAGVIFTFISIEGAHHLGNKR